MPKQPQFRFSTRNLSAGIRRELLARPMLARRAMTDVGKLLEKESRARAPKREGFLESDIASTVVAYKQSFAAVVHVPTNAPSASYAVAMHEGRYNLGELSEAKQSAGSVVVGRRFISRALEDNQSRIVKSILFSLRRSGGGKS